MRKIFDHVIELDTYTELDYEFFEKESAAMFDSVGGCTCAVKVTPDGQTIGGRNMDFYITNKPAYIIRTKCPGKHETVGISYTNFTGPDYGELLDGSGELADGPDGRPAAFDETTFKKLPFTCCDIMNDAGLYIEINMRNGEYNADGSLKFGCKGTNPHAPKRLCAMFINRYIAENCGSVEEALDYVRNELDLYTPGEGPLAWNFCFMLADSTGRYGLLEIACDKISWLEGQHAQANFYVTPDLADREDLRCGLGRYARVMENIDAVETEEDMFKLIDSVTYSQVYRGCAVFDARSEFVGEGPGWTSDYLTDDRNLEEITEYMRGITEKFTALSRREVQDNGKYWESIITVISNCQRRSLRVRFFEDNNRVIEVRV